MTPRRKQLIPSSTQKSADDELNTRETGMEYPVGSCTVLRTPLVIYFVKAAPHRCAWVTVIRMIAFLLHVWQENQMTIVFCRLWSATLRRITRAVPLSSLPRRIIPTCPSASLLHSRSVRLEASRMVAQELLECEACKPPLVALAAQNSDPMASEKHCLAMPQISACAAVACSPYARESHVA